MHEWVDREMPENCANNRRTDLNPSQRMKSM